ncbi:MAG: hypothetical protein QOE29_1464 [Gaiellaceae bacterium]|jgi:hypothetical protein|nr:hypothetical protein [Gaiellaceae bacterium]
MRRPPLRFQLSPSFVLASLALFFALGGSAFAFRAASAKVVRCPVGSARGVAFVTGDPRQGIENLPNDWSSADVLFKYRYNCSRGAVQVRKSTHGYGFDIRFLGNPGKAALASASSETTLATAIAAEADGSFHVSTAGDVPNSSFPNRGGSVVVVLF